MKSPHAARHPRQTPRNTYPLIPNPYAKYLEFVYFGYIPGEWDPRNPYMLATYLSLQNPKHSYIFATNPLGRILLIPMLLASTPRQSFRNSHLGRIPCFSLWWKRFGEA